MVDLGRVAVVMPAWNEESGIATFIEEINSSFPSNTAVSFIVVDDASSDQTATTAVKNSLIEVTVLSNERNLGHGPSTSRALQAGLGTGADFIISTDGDGQFFGPQLAALVEVAANSGVDVVEGVRVRPNEPLFRTLTSFITRSLVALRVHSWPTDANTPARAYRRDSLKRILAAIPEETSVPNLHISVVSRRLGFEIREVPVVVRDRLGGDAESNSWGGRSQRLPSSRFLRFCGRAMTEWVSPRNRIR